MDVNAALPPCLRSSEFHAEPRVGAVALGGGMHRLVRQIGLKRAMGYMFTSRRISAQEGYELALVNEVVPAAQLQNTVDRWCADILAAAPMSIRATKEAALQGLGEPDLESAIRHQTEYPGFAAWRNADDTREGPLAFAEKRAPVWKGR